MAEVRHRLGKGAYNFAQKTCRRYLLQSQNKGGKSATQAASVSAELLLAEIQNGGPHGAENTEDGVTVGASQESYTREEVMPTFRALPAPSAGCRATVVGVHVGDTVDSVCLSELTAATGPDAEPLYKSKTGYYEILEVMPTATHAQIKTAYYKQSFIYHPDRNAGSEVATVRFSEINEAYTVLGNKALRKKYDRGLLSQSDLVATGRPSGKETTGSSAKQQTDRRRSVMDPEARGGVFDFDTFFKSHYGEQLQREKEIRTRKEEMLKKKQETLGEKKLGGMLEMGVGMMLVLAVAILISLKRR
ncbi:DnaJ-like protein subfamily C member 30 [Nibea albiflora]|uniref:DnaJ-like protein subfamily C member 30 n=1 Tax=Nibea albiflora TaxID=240163 RepID=A0ACB7FHM0_NIBAL|nr:DnaJ-like protein subfamily C member 30 [Nibea albiflora]